MRKPVTGPNGKGIYPVSTINELERQGKIARRTFLVEANSSDEAFGLATRILIEWCKKEGRQFEGTRIHVGPSCIFNSYTKETNSANS